MQNVEVSNLLSGIVVVGFGTFLIGLAVLIVGRPPVATRFLASFASSAKAHYAEQALRLLVGAAIVNFSPSMWHAELFRLFGWLIVVTTVGLLLIPWQWHHKYAAFVMPQVFRRFRLFALGAAALGVLVLYGASRAVIS